MKITVEIEGKESIVFDDVYQFGLVGVMAGPKVTTPIFSYSIIQDVDILACLCDAMKAKIQRHGNLPS